ncbi:MULTISPECIES: hypothetical protein [unclassified Streptomyces]|uniref:hypothetical protein n=1 Tax=unclassified Streptomyces TaxID=2593676 RepID=UPI00093B47EA|nr:hypothetical protein [Streptomyces sp. CB02058]OKI92783.1 hypothetical protein AMK10_24115 [Streptomyces sp. CB02058]
MSSSLRLEPVPRDPGTAAGGAGPAPVAHLVRCDDGQGAGSVVAYVERDLPPGGISAYRAARGSGARSFALWADERREKRLASLVTVSAGSGVAVYQVLGAHGELLGTLVREKALRGRGLRTRWTVTPAGGPEAVGFKGRILWWFVWWLLSPLQILIIVLSLLSGDGDAARGPRRVVWRAGKDVPLEFRSKGDALHVHAPGHDPRLGAALVAVMRTFDSWLLGREWDDRKE